MVVRVKEGEGSSDVFFFFKQKTAYEIKECDWSSDVCSSDLSYVHTDEDIDKAIAANYLALKNIAM